VQHWVEERGELRRTSGVGVKLLKWAIASVEEGKRVTADVGAREAVGGACGCGKLRQRETRGDSRPVGTAAVGDCGRRRSDAAASDGSGRTRGQHLAEWALGHFQRS
jgi:hypothetical protein